MHIPACLILLRAHSCACRILNCKVFSDTGLRLPTPFPPPSLPSGLVFVPLSQPYLHEYGDEWVNSSPRRLYDKAMHQLMQRPGQQIVVMTQVWGVHV